MRPLDHGAGWGEFACVVAPDPFYGVANRMSNTQNWTARLLSPEAKLYVGNPMPLARCPVSGSWFAAWLVLPLSILCPASSYPRVRTEK